MCSAALSRCSFVQVGPLSFILDILKFGKTKNIFFVAIAGLGEYFSGFWEGRKRCWSVSVWGFVVYCVEFASFSFLGAVFL